MTQKLFDQLATYAKKRIEQQAKKKK